MKRIVLILKLFFLVIIAPAQNSAVDKLFEKYAGKDGYTTVTISRQMFQLFSQVETNSKEDKEFKDVTTKLTSIRILAKDEKSNNNSTNFYNELAKDLPASQYQELMVVKEKGQDVKFLTHEENGKITELILISGGKDNALICITGEIDLKTISKLSKSMQIQGMENLDQIKK
jgi:Domain of unknown function (DUF4252)